ncbi:MAG: peroxiredoxin-like family protein [Blastopirellula sp. JB062]
MRKNALWGALTIVLFAGAIVMGQESQTPTLQQQLQQKAADASKRYPAEMLKIMADAVESVRETGIEKSAKQVGDSAIDAELSGWDGKKVRLSEQWSKGPLVLMWYRGGWCPYCNLQLQAMQKELKTLEGAGAQLIVLTPELPEKAKETAAANQLSFVALHDKNSALARKYGLLFDLPETIAPLYRDRLKLAEVNGSDEMALPLSATYVIDADGKIRYAYLNADYKARAEPAEVVAEVKKIAADQAK